MPFMETKHFGQISFEPESELEFPGGLPGFDSRRRFVAVSFVESEPLIYLQSLEDPDLCFITMPILAVDPEYRLTVGGEDLGQLGLPLAPIVVNLRNRRAVQAVAPESEYSHQFNLMPQEASVCS